ncbi:Mitochondrial pyruvate carrier 2 [Mortierella polycephala]|uniref:Mitochondrial pyruvate carrier n=1 Tax=Mortierella polycephala TaxID=41804 RepID=A0A9P6Q0Q5_9FUNG|nr:Mitochondrial pyruvate carrier 2 [Mortierella polycephala]
MSSAAPAVAQSGLQKFLNHPAGPKTIHFWAPAAKWALVAAGVGDLSRPAENLSLSQNVALAATGLIWSRYSLVIIPKNYSLLTVNMFVAATGLTQIYRILDYRQGAKKTEETAPAVAPAATPAATN